MLDIIIFAAIAIFLVWRLRSVLGRRTGNERPRPDPISVRREADQRRADAKVVSLPERGPAAERPAPAPPTPGPAAADVVDAGAQPGLDRIIAAEPGFAPRAFLDGARAAFEMIVNAYAAGDSGALRPLLSDDVFAQFDSAIRNRAQAGETLATTLVGIDEATIAEAELQGRTALVTVRFVSQQINVTRDGEGRIVDGDPSSVTRVTDIWTFSRDTRARDPNWTLVATRSPA
ncbi:MAG: Tim44/TimA family putative adaptor protein [Dongiaceae bacterium]